MASDGNRWQNFFEESKSPHNTPHNKLFKNYNPNQIFNIERLDKVALDLLTLKFCSEYKKESKPIRDYSFSSTNQ